MIASRPCFPGLMVAVMVYFLSPLQTIRVLTLSPMGSTSVSVPRCLSHQKANKEDFFPVILRSEVFSLKAAFFK